MILLALAFLLCGILGIFVAYLYQNKDEVRIHAESQPRAPTLLALLLGIGLSASAIQVCGELSGVFGGKSVHVLVIKLLGLLVFASINGAAGVVAMRHFGGTNIKLFILLSAVTYVSVVGLTLGWVVYESEVEDWAGHLWFKVLQKLYKAIGSPAPLGLAAILISSMVFLSCFSGILSSYLPVQSSTERNRARVPIWASTIVTGLLSGAILAFSGFLFTYIYKTTDNEYVSTLLKVFGGFVQGLITILLATTTITFVNIQYESDDWQWRSFSIGGFAGIIWGISQFYILRAESIHGNYSWAVLSTSLLHGIVYGTSYGSVSLVVTYLIITRLSPGQGSSISLS